MKLIVKSGLAKYSENELSALFIEISRGLAQTERQSPERRNALASLENISHARMMRMIGGPAL